MTDRITIYIPAFNAAATTRGGLDRIPESVKQRGEEILIVDTHSLAGAFSVVEGVPVLNGFDTDPFRAGRRTAIRPRNRTLTKVRYFSELDETL